MHLFPSAPSCFMEPPVGMVTEVMRCHMKLQHPEGDHFTLINIYNTFKRSQKEPCERRSSSHECSGEERECVKRLCVCVCVRFQSGAVVWGVLLVLRRPADGRRHQSSTHRHPQTHRAARFRSSLRHQNQRTQHQESAARGLLHAGLKTCGFMDIYIKFFV